MADKRAMEAEKYLVSSICKPVSIVLEHLSPEVYQSKLKKGIKKKHEQRKERKEKEKIDNEETLLTSQRYGLRNRNKEHANKKVECTDNITKEVFKNTRHIDTWKYKRKYTISSSEESDSSSVMSAKQRKRKKVAPPKCQQNNKKFTIDNLFYLSINSNITNAKVALARLEDVHDDKYIQNWKKKATQEALSTKIVKHREQYRKLSTSTSSIDTLGNSHEDIRKNNENSISANKSSTSCDLKSRQKQYKNLEVLLVKLESLGVSLKKPTLASKVEKLTAKYNDTFRLNPLTYSNNVISNSGQSNIINECINETSVSVSFAEEDSNTVNQQSTNKTSVNMSTVEEESDMVNQQSTNKTSVNMSTVEEESDMVNQHSTNETSVNMSYVEEESDMVNQHSTNETSVNVSSAEEESNKTNQHSTNETSVNINFVQEENDVVNLHSISEPTTNSSLSDSILQGACNVKEFSLKPRPMEHQESTENVENVRASEQLALQTNQNAILPKQAEKSQNIGSLTETSVAETSVAETSVTESSVNNETQIVDCSSNVISEKDIDKANLERSFTTEAEKTGGLDSVNSDVIITSTNIEQRINDAFRYTCIACNSSFKEFRALPLHLRKCLARSQEKKSTHENNNKLNVSSDSVKIAEILKCDNTPKSSLTQPPSTTDDANSNSTLSSLKKKLARRRWKSLKLLNKQLQQKSNVQCSVCSEIFDTMMSLSDHIYTHTESELRKAYEIAKMKQISIKNSEENNVLTADTNEKTSSVAITEHNEVKTATATIENKKPKSAVAITEHNEVKTATATIENKKPKSADAATEHKKRKSADDTTEHKKAKSSDPTTEQKKTKSPVATTKHKKTKSSDTTTEHKQTKSSVATTKHKKAKSSDTTIEHKKTQSPAATTKHKKAKSSDTTIEHKKTQSPDTTIEHKKTQSPAAITEHKKTKESNVAIKPQKTQVDETSNTSLSVITESPKRMSNLPPVNYVSPVKFCDCHKPRSSDERCIELVLHCCVCKVIFRTKECFDAHLKKAKPSLCNSKQLMGTIQRLYCSACQIILYSFVDMRRHTENHVKNHQHIKLFCHICKVRFIGVGPIFNLHWFNHMRNLSYTASASNFPKASLVDSNSKIWSLITSDNYNYLIVTEHVCNFCNEQLFSTTQLQKHVSACSKRKDLELSRSSPENNDKEHNIDSELNLRLFCTLCKVMFKEKSLFETHAEGHKQHLQPQFICLSLTDIKRMYICNVCANVYDDLKGFQTHWQDHNAIREIFMCCQCKNNFPTLETFVDHSKQCDMSSIPLHEPSCQVTYSETVHNCKICNIGFDSYKALYQHSGIHNIKFSRLSIASSNEAQNDSIVEDISLPNPDTIQIDTEQLAVVSKDSIEKITTINNNITVEQESTLDILKDITAACTQSKSSAESKTIECVENELDHLQIDTSVNDNLSITDADTEVLSRSSDIEIEEINRMVQESCPDEDGKLSDSISKDKESEMTVTENVSPSDKPLMTPVQSDDKTETSETSMEDDVILIEPEVTSKETKISKEPAVNSKETKINKEPAVNSKETKINKEPAVISKETKISKEPAVTSKETKKIKCKSPAKVPEKNKETPKEATSDPKANDTSKSNEKPAEVHKYLRVKNISELMDQKVKYRCPTCGMYFDDKMTLENHSKLHNQRLPTSSNSQSILLPKLLSSGDLKNQNINMPPNQNSSNFQQPRTIAAVSEIPVPVQNFISYRAPQVTQQNINIPPTQYSNLPIRTVIHNVTSGTNMNSTLLSSTSAQSQNVYPNNQVLFQTLPLTNLQDSSNNLLNNNQPIQTSNNVSRIVLTNPTVVSTNNVVPKPAYSGIQSQDTHSRIKLQNAIHQKCSDKTANATPVNILPKPAPTQTLMFKPSTGLPISSSNQYYTNENFPDIYPSANVSNPQKNNPIRTICMNNAKQTSTFHQTSTVNSNVAPNFVQQHTVRHDLCYFKCHHCRIPSYFATRQNLDEHLNAKHPYWCEICNKDMLDLENLIIHKESSGCSWNTFQS